MVRYEDSHSRQQKIFNFEEKIPREKKGMVWYEDPHSVGCYDKCLILDLDATLICSITKSSDFDIFNQIMKSNNIELKSRIYHLKLIDVLQGHRDEYDDEKNRYRGEGLVSEMWGIERPGLKEFLSWASKSFKVIGVWSAGRKPYVHAICKKIFVGNNIRSPDFIWTYNDCDNAYDENINGEKSWYMLKNLDKLSKSVIGQELGITLENSILIDDREYSFSATPNNGILIPPYEPLLTIDGLMNGEKNDNILGCLSQWFVYSKFFTYPDVRIISKGPNQIWHPL